MMARSVADLQSPIVPQADRNVCLKSDAVVSALCTKTECMKTECMKTECMKTECMKTECMKIQ